MTSEAQALLDSLLGVMFDLEKTRKPGLKSVTMHPADFAALRAYAEKWGNWPIGEPATPDGLCRSPASGSLWFLGIPIYQNPVVPKGSPWYDPPIGFLSADEEKEKNRP